MRSGRSPPVANALSAADRLHAEPAPGALVGERGVDEAVEQHAVAAPPARPQLLRHELRAGGRVQQRLGARVDVAARGP